jgi:hypothetical protein
LLPFDEEEARMYSLLQIRQLWHLHYRRSNASKRLQKNDEENAELFKRVSALEQWKVEWIEQTKKRETVVDKVFEAHKETAKYL